MRSMPPLGMNMDIATKYNTKYKNTSRSISRSSVSTESYCCDVDNNNNIDDGDSCSVSIQSCFRVQNEPVIDLTHDLKTNWPKKKRARVFLETWNHEILEKLKQEVLFQFSCLNQAQNLGLEMEKDEFGFLESIRGILVKQCQVFLQASGVHIDETSILNILQFNKQESLDSDNIPRIPNSPKMDSDEEIGNFMKNKNVKKLKNVSGLVELKGKYPCKECKQIFSDFRALGGHMAFHNKKNMSESTDVKSNYPCEICNEVFDDFRALGGHVASHNRRKRQYEAGFNSSGLVAESLVDDTRQKTYQCNICSKSFSSGQALGGHKSFHKKNTEVTSSTQSPVFELDLNSTPVERSWGV